MARVLSAPYGPSNHTSPDRDRERVHTCNDNELVMIIYFHPCDTGEFRSTNSGRREKKTRTGALKTVVRAKIRHYRQLYLNRPDPIVFMPVAVDTSGRVYDDFSRLLFLHARRETSTLTVH
jgi:hypothetical protein